MNVYNRINEVRKRKGVTWKYLNDNIPGAYSSRMTEFKNGKTTLSTQQLSIVANILGTTTDYLLGNTDDPTPAGQKETLPAHGGEQLELNEEDRKILNDLHRLTPEDRAVVEALLIRLSTKEQSDV